MNNSALPYWLAFAVLLAGLYGLFKWRQVERFRPPARAEMEEISLPPVERFELTTSSGEPFRSEDMKGKVWVVTFFFSTCPGSCARLNANIQYLNRLEKIRDVTWVSITVDPQTDTLPVLSEYAKRFNADPKRWLFCRAEFNDVKRIAHDFLKVGGVSLQSHNDYAVIIDKRGDIADMFNASSTSESKRGVEILKKLLTEDYEPLVKPRAGSSPTPAARSAEAA